MNALTKLISFVEVEIYSLITTLVILGVVPMVIPLTHILFSRSFIHSSLVSGVLNSSNERR